MRTSKTSTSSETQPPSVAGPATPAPNGEEDPAAAAPLSDLFIAATELPNLDERPSVSTKLPQDLFMSDREDFAVAETARPASIAFGHPNDWAMCHPDPHRYRVMLCIKDKKSRKVLPITQSLVKKHPRLQTACRPHVVRHAILLDGPWFLWPAPWYGARYPGDDKHRGPRPAQGRLGKDGVGRTGLGCVQHRAVECLRSPRLGRSGRLGGLLTRGIAPLLLSTGDEPFLRRFLGRGR